MLRNAHAPEDDPRLGAGVGASDIAQGRGIDAADRRHLFGAVVTDMLAQRLEVLGVGLYVLSVVEALLDDGMKERVEQRNVAAWIETQRHRRISRQAVAARIDHEDFGAAL